MILLHYYYLLEGNLFDFKYIRCVNVCMRLCFNLLVGHDIKFLLLLVLS